MKTPSRTMPPRDRRHGTTYVFILGITLIVTVLGMGAMTLSRVTARSNNDANDWETAGTLAFSATEHALAYLNAAAAASPASWRASYTSGQTAFTQAVGRGTFSWAIKDETDNNLGNDYLQSFRVYGIGKVGAVTRVYSVQVSPGGRPLDVLRTAVHSSVSCELTGKTMNNYGPISSNGQVKLSGTVNAAIEAASITGSASGTQTVTVPAPAKQMPSPTVFDALAADATTLDYDAIGKKLDKVLLSPTSNPFGAPNAKGLYRIVVPSTKTFSVTKCRIVGTLLIQGTATVIDVVGPNLWEPGPTGAPILIANIPGVDLKIGGSDSWLSESNASVNFNPANTPFGGDSNTNLTDDLPPQYRGVIHLISGAGGKVEFNSNAYFNGTLIADCPIKTKDVTTLLQDSTIYDAPPFGYAKGDVLSAVGGTWRWDTMP